MLVHVRAVAYMWRADKDRPLRHTRVCTTLMLGHIQLGLYLFFFTHALAQSLMM